MVTGIFIKIFGILVVFASSNFWLGLVFDLEKIPSSYRSTISDMGSHNFNSTSINQTFINKLNI
jgi:hypothetical protein